MRIIIDESKDRHGDVGFHIRLYDDGCTELSSRVADCVTDGQLIVSGMINRIAKQKADKLEQETPTA